MYTKYFAPRGHARFSVFLILATSSLTACSDKGSAGDEQSGLRAAAHCSTPENRAVFLESGEFQFGQIGFYPEEGPVRSEEVDGFWIDTHEVTNRQFAAFVESTGYTTGAERPVDASAYGVPVEQIPPELLLPGSAVFAPPSKPSPRFSDWWTYVPGANWRKPYGSDGPDAVDNEPVVHLNHADMLAYAEWRGGRLPTEIEWEYAAKAGSPDVNGQPEEANSWQGAFPVADQGSDGFKGIAPVACYEANSWGLYDMVGNVWEAVSSDYTSNHSAPVPTSGEATGVSRPGSSPRSKVIKGGSFLCAPNYCQRYRASSRQQQDPTLGASHVGFRLAYDAKPSRRTPDRDTAGRN